jgi:hypothetical protein
VPRLSDQIESARAAANEACEREFNRGHDQGWSDCVTAFKVIRDTARRQGNDPEVATDNAIAVYEEHKQS